MVEPAPSPPVRRAAAIGLAAVLLATVFPLWLPTASAADGLRVGVMADTGVNPDAAGNVQRLQEAGVAGFLGLGDYAYDASVASWASQMRPMLDLPHHLARGNHDDAATYAPYVGHSGTEFSVVWNGVRVIGLDTEQRYDVGSARFAWLESELQRPESVKVLTMHKGWWLGAAARHPGTEFPGSPTAMDGLVDRYDVDLVLAGHEHNYQRAERVGSTFIINGAGGRSLYPLAGQGAGTASAHAVFGHMRLLLTSTGVSGTFHNTAGTELDRFTVTTGPSPPSGSFGVTFRNVRGNEWWVETDITASKPLAGVDARVNGGAWVALELKNWGSWAKSIHAPTGSRVDFRARATTGEAAVSLSYAWPGATPIADEVVGTTPTFTARFFNVRGNEWWVEADVTAKEHIRDVSARVNGGPWIVLDLKSWGSWAKSIHAPAGSRVEFLAASTSGATAQSAPFAWPPGSSSGGGTFTATWRCVSGNEWWVQACPSGGAGVVRVEVRLNEGAWLLMDKQSWGWSKNIHVPTGTRVQFLATDAAGATALSSVYVWPPG